MQQGILTIQRLLAGATAEQRTEVEAKVLELEAMLNSLRTGLA